MQGFDQKGRQGDQSSFNGWALEAYQTVIRVWLPHLTSSEFTVLMNLLDRTVGWRKTHASFSLERVTNGDKAYNGMKMSRRSLFYALSTLEKKNMITRRKHPEGKQIRVYSVNLVWTPALLAFPKHLKTSADIAPNQCKDCTQPVQILHPRESNPGEGIQEKVENTVPSVRSTIDPPIPVRKEIKTFRAARAGKATAQTGSISPVVVGQAVEAAQEAWQAALAEVHPTGVLLAWSQRDVGMVKGKAKGWAHGQRISFPDFIDWCVRNWSAVCRTQLKWMTQRPPPTVPSLGFLIAFIDHFVDCWASGALEQWMSEADRNEYDRLIASGRTHDEALREVGKAEAIDQMREENQRIRREAAIESRISRRRLEQAQRLENAPVHPRSRIALEARKAEKGLNPSPSRFRSEDELRKHDFTAAPILDPNWEPPIQEFH